MSLKSKLNAQFFTDNIGNKKIHSLWIFIGTFIFVLLIIFTFFNIYNIAIDETKRNHQILQKDMADAAATGIKYYLENLANDISLLTTFHQLQNLETDYFKEPTTELYNHAKNFGVKTVFVTDIRTKLIYSTTDTIPAFVNQYLENQVEWAKNPKNWGSSWFSPVWPEVTINGKNEIHLLILTPIVKHSDDPFSSSKNSKPVGMIGEVVNFNWLVEKYIASINLGGSGVAWIMDSQGRLLYHPEHPEMILRDISEKSPDCISCHASFEVQKRMINSDAYYGEYTVGNEPTKIMSHVPIEFRNDRWVLVISSNLSDVTFILRSKFRLFFIIVIVILAANVTVGFLFYYVNTKRVRAEEARRLSEHKELLHQQICHASKLASIGELVDTVAHEINTPVSIIVAQTQALNLRNNNSAKDFPEELEIIKQQTKRISNYTHRLLNYSRIMPFLPKPLDLTPLFDECLYLVGHRLRAYNITIEKIYSNDLQKPVADRSQIEQVFINLLNNAIDAIGRNGKITVAIKQISEEKVEIKVADNGEGISEESLSQIFNPFFTTKQPSRGTGLGLSISKAIIQRHQGKISVTSKVGAGSTFSILLPLSDKT
jgi:signal transduction histidine kinase